MSLVDYELDYFLLVAENIDGILRDKNFLTYCDNMKVKIIAYKVNGNKYYRGSKNNANNLFNTVKKSHLYDDNIIIFKADGFMKCWKLQQHVDPGLWKRDNIQQLLFLERKILYLRWTQDNSDRSSEEVLQNNEDIHKNNNVGIDYDCSYCMIRKGYLNNFLYQLDEFEIFCKENKHKPFCVNLDGCMSCDKLVKFPDGKSYKTPSDVLVFDWKNDKLTYCKNDKTISTAKNLISSLKEVGVDGSIIFKCANTKEAIKIISDITDFNWSSCGLSTGTVHDLKFISFYGDNIDIICADYDCEAG